jgi:hypothetical protein
MSAAFIGLDLAKSVFQFHGRVVVTKRLRRDAVLAFFADLAPCVVGMNRLFDVATDQLQSSVMSITPDGLKPKM